MVNSIRQKQIDKLVWLGVGELQSPEILEQAKRSILVDPNRGTINSLQKALPSLKSTSDVSENIKLVKLYLAVNSGEQEFYEYSLGEYSALSKASGLTQLFPGIKLKQTFKVNTVAITEFIQTLSLNRTQKNTLWLDIIDQALPMLQALAEEDLLSNFDNIKVQSSLIPLYQNAGTTSDLIEFLVGHGYELILEDTTDPDIPKLSFTLNELWQPLQELKKVVEDKNRELIELKERSKNLENRVNELKGQRKVLSLNYEKVKQEKKELILNKKNSAYVESDLLLKNEQNNDKIELLEKELVKVESQILLIRDLFL